MVDSMQRMQAKHTNWDYYRSSWKKHIDEDIPLRAVKPFQNIQRFSYYFHKLEDNHSLENSALLYKQIHN